MSKKIILFLDIDGVLNACGADPEFYPDHERTTERFHGFIGICPKRVALLNEVIERTGAVIVMSSTWRLGDEQHWKEVNDYLKQQGFKGEVIDKTPNHARGFRGRGRRGGEVNAWLKANAAKFPEGIHHAIVDDDNDFDPDQPLVLTKYYKGLTRDDVEALVKLLTPEPKIDLPPASVA